MIMNCMAHGNDAWIWFMACVANATMMEKFEERLVQLDSRGDGIRATHMSLPPDAVSRVSNISDIAEDGPC